MDDPKPASSDKNEQDVSNDPLNQPYDDKQPETYVTPTGEPTAIAPMATPLSLQKPKSHSGRWLFRGIVVLLIAVLGAFGYWQWTEAQSASNERASLQSELETVKAAGKTDTSSSEPDDTPVSSDGEDFIAFSTEYSKFVESSVALTDVDEKAIETAIKDYYKLTTLPEGWQIIVAYKDAKADTTTGKPVNALVYWPASATKPAGFFEVTQSADGKWAYNEQR